MPETTIAKAPSAELRDNQTDQDSLPPYPVLDDMLECLVEKEMSVDKIVARNRRYPICAMRRFIFARAKFRPRRWPP